MKSKGLGLILGIVITIGMIGTGVIFYHHYSDANTSSKKSQELAERKKEVEQKAKDKDKSAYYDEKTGQYISSDDGTDSESDKSTDDTNINTRKRGRNYVIDDKWVDKSPEYDPSKEYNADDFIVGTYTLDDGSTVPIYDDSEYQNWLYGTYLPKCIYKDAVNKVYKDELVDEYGILVPWVKVQDGDYNFNIFDKKGNIKKKYIDEKTGKLTSKLKKNISEYQLDKYEAEREEAESKLSEVLGE